MSGDHRFAYAQARIQARFAGLPSEQEWQRLAASRTLASFLEEARGGALRDWVKGFSGLSDVHDLEAGLRALYLEHLEAVARWVPAPWRQAVAWTLWLTRLPLLAHFRAGASVPGWVARDRELRRLLDDTGSWDPRRLADAGAGPLLESADAPVAAWIAEWRRCWPRCRRSTARDLDGLIALLSGHADAFSRVPPAGAWRLRGELRERLRLRFHQRLLQPAAPFIFLVLAALDLERLRAALVSRALFAAWDEPAGAETEGEAAA
jgi:hypothetical protein